MLGDSSAKERFLLERGDPPEEGGRWPHMIVAKTLAAESRLRLLLLLLLPPLLPLLLDVTFAAELGRR